MRINNNIMAMNTHRQYATNNAAVANSTEKLSSGYRINRAGDDAAGLAISEKMRAQIRGLQMASKNSQDAISLVQTAEGALTEVHSMLQRMNELANQAATGTNEDVDREAISAEFTQLKQEIDDIAGQTNFNNMKLLDGSFGQAKMAVASTSTLAVGKSIAGTNGTYSVYQNTGMTASKAGDFVIDLGSYSDGVFTSSGAATGSEEYISIKFTDDTTNNVTNTVVKISDVLKGDVEDGSSFTLNLTAAGLGTYSIAASDAAGTAAKTDFLAALDAETVTTMPSMSVSGDPELTTAFTTDAVAGLTAGTTWTGFDTDKMAETLALAGIEIPEDGELTINLDVTSAANVQLVVNGTSIDTGVAVPTAAQLDDDTAGTIDLTSIGFGTIAFTGGSTVVDATEQAGLESGVLTVNVTGGNTEGAGAIEIQVGAQEGEQLAIGINKMDSASLGLADANISLQEDAGKAVTLTRAAINTVSSQRANLGALQNRLQHKINNLDTSAENLQAAESRIRDLDMAQEMTTFTKNNILVQAATAMLAQANSAPQGVLKLLQ